MKFTHLHVHSHYSLLDGLAKIDQLLDYCQELGMDSLALTDHGTMYGAIEFYKKALARSIKPIIGSEAYLALDRLTDKRPRIDDRRHHLVLLAKDKIGYQNLIKLTTIAWLDGFYYKPRIDKEVLKKYSQGLIGLSACLSGEIPKAIIADNIKKAEKLALEYQEIFGSGNFFLEIEHHPGIPEQSKVNQAIIQMARKLGLPLVATHDVHYLKPEDAQAQDILMAVNTSAKLENENRLTMRQDNFSLQPPEQMFEWFEDIPEAITNTQKIAEVCNLEIKLNNLQLPHFPVPKDKTADSYLAELCHQGLKQRYQKVTKDILKRLDYELRVIKQTGFASYFLIVQDFVKWAKNNGIVCGPGRGSAAGSLVSYLLNITDIDPLVYNLIFERFLNPDRISMPDIDLDFADTRRDEVIDYVTKKYGREYVAQIITFGTMAARAAVRDVGRAMGYPYSLCDQVAKTIPFGLSLEKALHESIELHQMYDSDEQIKRLIDTALKLEGVARHVSTHAAGIVITKETLDKSVPLQHPTQDDRAIVTQYEMYSIEDLGLLKIDFLGLKTLTQIENTIKIVQNTKDSKVDISSILPDDPLTYKLLQEGRTTGVFQLESGGMKKYLRQLKPTTFEDIIAMVALYRPGPMELIPEFVARKHGLKKIEYLHPKLEKILKNTYGIAVYQEQLMEIAKELAGFTMAEADILRKAVGKKIKKLLDKQRDKLIKGMKRNNVSQKTAEKIWKFIEPFARYGFNRSHATCYAMIGYQTAYLKAHFPTEFMAALLNSEQNDIERVAFLVDECRQMNIEVLPPDINESLENFTFIKEGVIRFGLATIKNVGQNIVATIVQERKNNGPFRSISEFIERLASLPIQAGKNNNKQQGSTVEKNIAQELNKKSLESLIKCGALDKLGERGQLLFNLENILGYLREIQKPRQNGQVSLFEATDENGQRMAKRIPQLKLQEAKPATKKEKLSWEKELLGLYVSEHPINEYQEKFKNYALPCSKLSSELINQRVRVAGVISKIQKIITRGGRSMLFVQIEDAKSKIEVLVFPNILEKSATLWQEEKAIIVGGRLDDKDGNLKILCDEVKEVK